MERHDAAAHRVAPGTWLALGAAAAAGGVTLSPYILPPLGIGSEALRTEVMMGLHGSSLGSGLAGAVNQGLSAVPGIGESLAAGGTASMLGTAVLGIGGMWLANRLQAKEAADPQRRKWSGIIRAAALGSSLLIALPSILTGLSIGITFLASAFGSVAFASTVMTAMAGTLGSAGAVHLGTGLSGLAVSALPHLLTCGAVLVPVALSLFMGRSRDAATHKAPLPQPLLQGPYGLEGRVAQPAVGQQRAIAA